MDEFKAHSPVRHKRKPNPPSCSLSSSDCSVCLPQAFQDFRLSLCQKPFLLFLWSIQRKDITYLATQINSFNVEGAGFGSLIRVYAKARFFTLLVSHSWFKFSDVEFI
jgi:hypothetical protein